jgi:TetR/AcrR family transcriptional repressor of nem operon
MRRSKRETAETRQRIVRVAAAEIRKKGIEGTGLADVMAAAGLTHGGFYRHFESKEGLVTEACSEAVDSSIERVRGHAAASGKDRGLDALVAEYLSTRHRDHPEGGCLLAALGSELTRCDDGTREAATGALLKLVDIVTTHYSKSQKYGARHRALVAVSTMIGALTMSRVVTDPRLSADILSQARKHLTQGLIR